MIVWKFRWYWVAVNATEILLFRHDKERSKNGGWRVSESTLLGMAFLGGTPGALWASQYFRHKIRKGSFMGQLGAIAALQVAILYRIVVGEV